MKMADFFDLKNLQRELESWPKFEPRKMSKAQILQALSNPRNWKQFVKRGEGRDSWVTRIGGYNFRVTAVTEKVVIVRILRDDLSESSVTAKMKLTVKGLSSDKFLPKFHLLEEWVIKQLAQIILGSTTDPRPRWRRLPKGQKARRWPPAELLKEGVPESIPGFTFAG